MSKIFTFFLPITQLISKNYKSSSPKKSVYNEDFSEFDDILAYIDEKMPKVSERTISNIINFSRCFRSTALKNHHYVDLFLN
jgi:mevalonate pyrophosphate decarboxylase